MEKRDDEEIKIDEQSNVMEGKLDDNSDSEHDSNDCCGHCHDHVNENNYNETVNELEMLQERLADLDNKAKYAQAELVNYRKRKDDEVRDMLKYANQDLIMEIIPIIDNFERAFGLNKNDDDKVSSFLEGFKMLYNSLIETLKKFGVEEIEALGKEFDPNMHLALITQKDKSKENDIVLEVLLKGYTLKGKMIRPASVKVNRLD